MNACPSFPPLPCEVTDRRLAGARLGIARRLLPVLLLAGVNTGAAALANAGDVAGDRDALMELHAATEGGSWFDDTNWGSTRDLGAWRGVRTAADGRVAGLALAYNNLAGTLPAQLGDLTMLESLELNGNRLTGPVPREIGSLERLELLDLSGGASDPANGNRLTGEIPDELSGLGALRTLHLGANRLSGAIPASLGALRSLVRLDLSANSLGGEIPGRLGDLEALELLNLSENNLTGFIPAELGMLRRLRELNLSQNALRGEIPPELGNLRELDQLSLGTNALAGELPPELGNLSGLSWFRVGNNLLEGEIPPWLADLGRLKVLSLAYNGFTGGIPPGLGYLVHLDFLLLEGNRLSGEIPHELGRLEDLGYLGLGGNGLTGKLPGSLTALKGLQSFDLGGTEVCMDFDDVETKRWLRGIPRYVGRVANCPNPEPVYLVQSVQSFETPTTLVAGRPALLRVFLASEEAAGMEIPSVEATFHDERGEEVHRVEMAAGGTVPKQIDEGSLDASANAEIPGRVIRPGVELAVAVEGGLPGLPARIPARGRIVLDVEAVPPLPLTLIPLQTPEDSRSAEHFVDAVVARGEEHPALRQILDFLPVEGVEAEAHEPVATSSSDMFEMLRLVTAIRRMEAGAGYWQGVTGPAHGSRGFGLAWLDDWTSYADPDGRTMAHELAHNMSLSHAPCGRPPGIDWYYPDSGARIGSWGYNRAYGLLVPPTTLDIMSYCHPSWTSEYGLSRALTHRMRAEATETVEEASAAREGRREGRKEPTLLLWGGVDARGEPYLRPSFLIDAVPHVPAPGDGFVISGRTADGAAFSLAFDMPPLPDAADERAFVITLPVTWSGNIESIRLASRDQAATLDLGTVDPMTILRDPTTGQVRAILDSPAAEAMGRVPGVPLEVFESFGIDTP